MYATRLGLAAQEGDDAAFAALYDRNAAALYDFCWALTGDDAEAARMVEDAFVLALWVGGGAAYQPPPAGGGGGGDAGGGGGAGG